MGEGCGCSGASHDDKAHEKQMSSQNDERRQDLTENRDVQSDVKEEKVAPPREDVYPVH